MKTSEEFILDVKTKAGDQRTKDGRLIRDIDDKELMKKMLERYPGERENIVDIDDIIGQVPPSLISDIASSFAKQMIYCNRTRLLRLGDQL